MHKRCTWLWVRAHVCCDSALFWFARFLCRRLKKCDKNVTVGEKHESCILNSSSVQPRPARVLTWYMTEEGRGSMHGCWSGSGSSSSRSTLERASSKVTADVMLLQRTKKKKKISNLQLLCKLHTSFSAESGGNMTSAWHSVQFVVHVCGKSTEWRTSYLYTVLCSRATPLHPALYLYKDYRAHATLTVFCYNKCFSCFISKHSPVLSCGLNLRQAVSDRVDVGVTQERCQAETCGWTLKKEAR